MVELLSYIRESLLGEWHGPLAFRLILQPAVEAFLGIRAGLCDARAGRPPCGWQLLTRSGHRGELIRDGWRQVYRLFIAAAVIDLVYQFIAFHRAIPPKHWLWQRSLQSRPTSSCVARATAWRADGFTLRQLRLPSELRRIAAVTA
jgi:hypothetical protein